MAPATDQAHLIEAMDAVLLEKVVLGQFNTARPCDSKANRPPGAAALAARAVLLGAGGAEPRVDLAEMAELIRLAFPGSTIVYGSEGVTA